MLTCIASIAAMTDLPAQDTIIWNSTANATNLTSSGTAMDGNFRFEVGVFSGSFIPTASNKADWAANWNGHRRASYVTATQRFAGSFVASDNTAPFSIGANAYIWGFRGGPASGEWILFRAPSWTWPDANSFPPSFVSWEAAGATPVLGQINASGSPFLLKSAAVSNAMPPSTSYSQWQAEQLTGEPLSAPNDDPDKDGVCNLLEFVFGTPPKTAGAPVATPITLASGFLQISIPRRLDHTAVLTVEVSGNLADWFSGAAHTVVVSDGPAALIVRDLTALGPAHPRRFIRLRAALPPP
jgi:hypothetical protein